MDRESALSWIEEKVAKPDLEMLLLGEDVVEVFKHKGKQVKLSLHRDYDKPGYVYVTFEMRGEETHHFSFTFAELGLKQ